MKTASVSTFLLERYRIGEVTPEEKLRVENALANDAALAAELAELDRGDRDFWQRYPPETIFPANIHRTTRRLNARRLKRVPPLVWGLCAAAAVLVVAIPLFMLRDPTHAGIIDRIKGASAAGSIIELNVYLWGNSAGDDVKLQDQTAVQTGNTVQLAYRIQGDHQGENSAEKYGVIFSIDGRSSVTLHYPYSPEQSTRLVSGKAVPLDEAYTLDDAPHYEIFFFVVADKPIDVKSILNTAQWLAFQIAEQPQEAQRLGATAFKGREVKVITLRKM